MSPNTVNSIEDNVSSTDTVPQQSTNRLEILYKGYFYDVTDFVKKHPGGSVIKYYTEKGEDATNVMQQFHNRSMNKIDLMLKSFKKRPISKEDESKSQPSLALTHQSRGYYEIHFSSKQIYYFWQ